MSEKSPLQINWISSAGGALGAVSSAVVLSTFGVAGTLIGAAIGSLCISVGGALYAHSLKLAKERMELAKVAATRNRVRAHGNPAAEVVAAQQLEASEDSAATPAGGSRGQAVRDLPWRRIVAATVALFVVAMGLVVAFELTVGRPVSTFTGGGGSDQRTSIPGVGGHGGDSGTNDPDQQQDQHDSPEVSEPPTPDETTATPEPEVPSEEVPTTPAPTEVSPSQPTPTPDPTAPAPPPTP